MARHLRAQSVLLEKVPSLAADTAVVGVRVFPDVQIFMQFCQTAF
jgi:hypothetical protein